ncbi:replication-associated recombination protein A [Pseudoxanthomonas sp. CAU 1598]|uniref:Replication-associated recombination protein A n=1 Tax=Pseudomarimonas arenosa TaxID=2774145 RepID=A0AAW3ZI17_9GAMM|nr:replication-associated recombination protein A [Pseudomarimonas arenosa]
MRPEMSQSAKHRFNKLQQDAFLPGIEAGEIVFVGATTENPSFELNSALLSRCRVHVLESLTSDQIASALRRALEDAQRGLGSFNLRAADAVLETLAVAADGDLRRALTLLEIAVDSASAAEEVELTLERLAPVLADRRRRFDKGGEQFYDQISALHKCVRSSNPDAALYWFVRMLDGGCDPHYLARRLVRMAVEDIGLADPRALQMANDAWQAYDRLGSPEGELALAQLVLYLASTAKSNAAYAAYKSAQALVGGSGTEPVPMHLRNAPTGLMKSLGYGEGYQYDHDQVDGVAIDQTGFPPSLGERVLYQPVDRGLESKLKAKLDDLRARRRAAQSGNTE